MTATAKIFLQKRICGFGLIVPYKTGVVYTNQTGGPSLEGKALEGVFIPLYNRKLPNPLDELWHHFSFGEHGPRGCRETPDFIDSLISKCTGLDFIKVDRARLAEIQEAWVPVTITYDKKNHVSWLYEDFWPSQGILTWENSD